MPLVNVELSLKTRNRTGIYIRAPESVRGLAKISKQICVIKWLGIALVKVLLSSSRCYYTAKFVGVRGWTGLLVCAG